MSALLGGAIERYGDDADGFRVCRVTVDMLRPVPIGPMRYEVEPVRLGSQAQWIDARAFAQGKLVARATGLRIRRREVDLPAPHCPPLPPPPLPHEAPPSFEFPFFGAKVGYHTSVEVKVARGTWGARGPVAGWIRPKTPLFEDRPLSALERVLVAADAANGVTMALDPSRYAFVNPDLAVYLRRAPTGEWVGLDGRSTPEADGIGLGQSVIHDQDGEVGRCLQTLVVSAHEGSGAPIQAQIRGEA